MKTNVVFKDFQRFEHLVGFVNDALAATLGKYEGNKPLEVKVILATTHARHHGQPMEFQCEALLTSNRRKNLFAKKTHVNFYTAVKSCMKTLEKIIGREMHSKIKSRRHKKLEQPPYNYSSESFEFSEDREESAS
jgi:ribosome-associated translation inhibitor RaiA